VLVLAMSALVLLVGVVAAERGAAVLARHRAQSAADLAALAAAAQIGVSPDPCRLAAPIAAANRAQLVSCQPTLDPDGRSGTVRVLVRISVHLPLTAAAGTQTVRAAARAGRLRPGTR